MGLWLFEEGSGDLVRDTSGLEHHGETMGDPVWTQGRNGGGLEFDGVDDEVRVPDSDALEFPEDFTLAVWIRTTAAPPEPPAIITKGYHDRSNTRPWYLLYYRPAGTMTLYLRSLGAVNTIADGVTPINDGEWHHVVGMKVGNEARVYIDGALDGSAPLGEEDVYGGNDYPLVFMRHYDRHLAGAIDEVAIFNRALSEDELRQLRDRGAESFLSVDSRGKLATRWGDLKAAR
ncbi:MAG: hypothetical protein KatS3mg115_1072 [Candidatus Poribacteria bacterium]|nr:MAG: hypothetical protein KatS3mg115_1072 [Candidatus Poribacteria bacterium]